MQMIEKFTLTLVVIAAMVAVTIGASGEAAAQTSSGCTDDSECTNAGEVCYNGQCEVKVCGTLAHRPGGKVIARFAQWPGNAIVVTSNLQDTASTSTCTVGAPNCDTMYYQSQFIRT